MSKTKVSRQVPENVAKRKFGVRGVHWDYEGECAPVESGATQQEAGEAPQPPLMRAKLCVANVIPNDDGSESVSFHAVSRDDAYPDDGSDENNTYAKFSPVADLDMLINNPALAGKLKIGQEYYVDFTLAKDVTLEVSDEQPESAPAEGAEASGTGTSDEGAAEAGEATEDTVQGSDEPKPEAAD